MDVERSERRQKAPTTERARSISILAWLHGLQAIALLVYGLALLAQVALPAIVQEEAGQFLPLGLFDWMRSGLALVVLGGMGLFVALALFRRQKWAWLVAMSYQGLGLLAGLISYWRGQPHYFGLLVGIILVFYLNQHDVRLAFQTVRPSIYTQAGAHDHDPRRLSSKTISDDR